MKSCSLTRSCALKKLESFCRSVQHPFLRLPECFGDNHSMSLFRPQVTRNGSWSDNGHGPLLQINTRCRLSKWSIEDRPTLGVSPQSFDRGSPRARKTPARLMNANADNGSRPTTPIVYLPAGERSSKQKDQNDQTTRGNGARLWFCSSRCVTITRGERALG